MKTVVVLLVLVVVGLGIYLVTKKRNSGKTSGSGGHINGKPNNPDELQQD
jgi:hypothetical protein